MRKWRHIYIDLYQVNIYFIKCSPKYYDKMVRSEFDTEPNSRDSDVTGRFEVHRKGDVDIYVIWIEDWDVFAHELFHCVHHIMKERGLWLTDSSEEAYAYLIGYLDRKLRK